MNAKYPSRTLLSGVVLLLAACAYPKPGGGSVAAPVKTTGAPPVGVPNETVLFPALPESPAIDRLRARAGRQTGSPITARPAPAWLPESEYISDDNLERASAPLDDVLRLVRLEPRFAAATPVSEPTEADHDQAMRLYARSRLARAHEENSVALSALEAASKLDPGASEIWRAMGDAQMAAGLRSSAMRSFQTAAERGLDDARVWALIGLEAVRRRDTGNALRWLLAARDGLSTGADPIAVSWIEVAMGELLLNEHRARAGADLLRSALSRPISDASRSAFQNEYATLVRRRPQLWLRVGDAEALLGEWDRASDAYDHAAAEATPELADEVALRRIAVLTVNGRTAEASLSLLDRIGHDNGHVTDEDLRTMRRLGADEPDLSPAIAELAASLEQPTSAVRSRLLLARFAASAGPVDIRTIDPDAALGTGHVVELLHAIETDEARWDLARALTQRRPSDAAAIADALFAGGMIRGPRLMELSSGTDLLSLRVRLRMDLPNRSNETEFTAVSPEPLVAWIETATRLGRWSDADRLVATAVGLGGMVAAEGLEAGSHADRALAVWGDSLATDGSVGAMLLGARLALVCGRESDAATALLRAHGAYPADERVYELMLRLLSGTTPFDERPKIEEAVRSMRTQVPEAASLEAIEVAQILSRGLVADGNARAQALVDRLAAPTLGDFGALLVLWNQAAERGDADMLASAEQWLARGLDAERPTEARAIALARVTALRSTASDALAALTPLPLAPTPALLTAEAELLKQAGRKPEAIALLHPLYDHESLSVGDAVQLAFLELDEHDSLSTSLDRMGSIPRDIRVRPEDLPALAGLCNALMSRMIELPSGSAESIAAGLQYAAVAGFAVDLGAPLPEAYHRVRLRSLAQSPGTPLKEIERATAQMHEALGGVGRAAFEDVYLTLLERSRTQDALLWAADTAMLGDELDTELWPMVAGQLASVGTVATVELVMERLEAHAMLAAAVVALTTQEAADATPDLRAELAYGLAGIASFRDRGPQAKQLYLLALRFEPEHPWACNDYGYMLVDRDEQLDEAARLIEIAYKALPERANVLDSMGWLRYRQGRFDGPDGALSLLEMASAAPGGASNATILDHLGDARWMTGDDRGAGEAWERAQAEYLRQVGQLTTPDLQRQPVYAKTQARLGQIGDKLRLLDPGGQDPPVARSNGTRAGPTE